MEKKCTKGIPHHRITYAERQLIEEMLEEGYSTKDIASAVGCGQQAMYREIQRGYDAQKAQLKVGSR